MSKLLRLNLREDVLITPAQQIRYKTQIGVCVQDALRKRGYVKADSESGWNIYWAQKQCIDSVFQNNRIGKNQKVNHYRNYFELCRKDNLNRNLKKFKRTLQKQGKLNEALQYNFYPLTYHLPIEYNMFIEQFKRNAVENNRNIWIMKPVSRSQGKGIFLFNKLLQISQWAQNPQAEAYIVQRYIDNPLLIGNKKFDLRLYVLCTSYRPLNAYLYRDGFARFTHYRYDNERIDNREVHLTNVAIQKHTDQYNQDNGGKWLLAKLKLYMFSKYGGEIVNRCFYDIQLLVAKTLRSVSKMMSNERYCFQLYGFDILIDQNFKPWLIQINGSPSMRANTSADKKMKVGLVDDVLSIIDIQNIMLGNQQQIGGFDLICKNDVNKTSQFVGTNKTSMLGCLNNRQQNYRQLAKNINISGLSKKVIVATSSPNQPNSTAINNQAGSSRFGINGLPQLNNPVQITDNSLNNRTQQSFDITASSPPKSFSVRKQFGRGNSPTKPASKIAKNTYDQSAKRIGTGIGTVIGSSNQFDLTAKTNNNASTSIGNPISINQNPASPQKSSSKNWIIRRGKRNPGQQSMPQRALFQKIETVNPEQ